MGVLWEQTEEALGVVKIRDNRIVSGAAAVLCDGPLASVEDDLQAPLTPRPLPHRRQLGGALFRSAVFTYSRGPNV